MTKLDVNTLLTEQGLSLSGSSFDKNQDQTEMLNHIEMVMRELSKMMDSLGCRKALN